jgi:hypothetical protein
MQQLPSTAGPNSVGTPQIKETARSQRKSRQGTTNPLVAQAHRKMPHVLEKGAEPPLETKAGPEGTRRDQDTHDKRRLPLEEKMASPQNRHMHLERP